MKTSRTKSVIGYIAGSSAPVGKKVGHTAAIIVKGRGDYYSKTKSLRAAGVIVVENVLDVASLVNEFSKASN